MVDVANTTSEQKCHGLLCRACRVDLVVSKCQGIEIDYYPKCRCVWLDRGELDKIIERSTTAESQGVPVQPYPPQGRYYDDRRGGHAVTMGAVGGGRSCRICSTSDVVPGLAQPSRRGALTHTTRSRIRACVRRKAS